MRIVPTTVAAVIAAGAAAYSAERIYVTQDDVEAMTTKVSAATRFFETTWRDAFAAAGYDYPAPRFVAYRTAARSGCGIIAGRNAQFCTADNTVYYNTTFLAGIMKGVSQELGTDGDYAPIVILAHEMGHGVAILFRSRARYGVVRESVADCLAGAVTRRAEQAGNLEKGDLEEGMMALALGGDPDGTPVYADQAHGSSDTRQESFLTGYRRGIPACDSRIGRGLSSAPLFQESRVR
jgi:predicted metalloprotease